MDRGDLFVEAIHEARTHAPSDCPTGGVDAFLRCAPDWAPVRLAQECARLVAELSGAEHVVLHARQGDQMVCSAMHPPQLYSPLAAPQQEASFPWGIDALVASRYMAVHDASALPVSAGGGAAGTLGELGLHSAVHLPLRAGNRAMGALHLYWATPGVVWDDTTGPLVRAVGVFTLERIGRTTGIVPEARVERPI